MIIPNQQKCGFFAIVGAPNAGKSTMMNEILGTKISIVSHKAQTTRSRMAGIHIHRDTQLIFIDTPGIFKPAKRFEKAMVSAIWDSIADADAVLLLYDACKRNIDDPTKKFIDEIQKEKKPVFLILNKIDRIKKEDLLSLIKQFSAYDVIEEIFMVSALKNQGLTPLLDHLANISPLEPWHYPEDQITDVATAILAAEITREKIFQFLHKEIPYNCTVETTKFEEFRNDSVLFEQTIFVAREAHKKIILGKGGEMIKKIGQLARKDLDEILEQQTHVKLFIKVKKNWMEEPDRYEALGLSFNPETRL